MANYRDTIRTKLAEAASEAAKLGKNLDDTRLDSRGTQATSAQLTRLANDTTRTQGHERIAADDFAGQTFNGTNQDFTISRRVLGKNILVWRVDQASGSLIALSKTTNPAPSGDQFWFDDIFTVRVGTAPQALDGLLAVYVAPL